MRILLDQAIHSMRNKGNVALLQTTVNRLNKLLLRASLEVLTEAPHLLKLYCPSAHPVSVYPWNDWSQKKEQIDRLHHLMPWPVFRLLLEAREEVAYRWPNPSLSRVQQYLSALLHGNPSSMVESDVDKSAGAEISIQNDIQNHHDLLQAIHGTNLFVATGGGYMCDSDKSYLLRVLDRLEMAIKLGKPTAMVGQGVGPLEDPELQGRLRSVLPYVNLILVREQRIAIPLLRSLGVTLDKVMMTGDDAIEMAYQERPLCLGKGIGVNLRIARYTQIGRYYIDKIRPILHQSAHNYKAPLIALPISRDIREPDHVVIRELLAGYKSIAVDWRKFDTPSELIKKTGRCRLVVTGAFHPAVFALAQGIPAVGLVKSIEYYNKFMGLRDEFGQGCSIIHLGDEQFGEKLQSAINAAWESAEELRPQLLKAALHQIELSYAGYRRLCNIVR